MLKTYVAAVLPAVPAAAATRPFTAKDLASIERVSSPSISPDGRYVAYSVRTTVKARKPPIADIRSASSGALGYAMVVRLYRAL